MAATNRTSPWASCWSRRCIGPWKCCGAAPPWIAAGMLWLLDPADADLGVGGHVPILLFSARGAQEATVSISASGVKRAFPARQRLTVML